MKNNEKALAYLEKNIYKNCDLITFIEIYPDKLQYYYCESDGVCFIFNDETICISTDNEIVALKVSKLIPKKNIAICKSEHDFRVLNNINKFINIEKVYQFIFDKDFDFKDDNIVKLEESDAEFIVKNYSKDTSIDDILSLMKTFNFYGYMKDNKIAGYIGRHLDGEIGFLEVLPEYRRMGIGTKLLKRMLCEITPTIPYSQVLIDNYKSIELHKKLGAKQYENIVYWCY